MIVKVVLSNDWLFVKKPGFNHGEFEEVVKFLEEQNTHVTIHEASKGFNVLGRPGNLYKFLVELVSRFDVEM